MTKMIPPVPTSAVMLPTPKQKIGFSIDSIVGNDANATNHNATNTTTTTTTTANAKTNEQTNLNNKTTQNGPTSPPQTPPAHLPNSSAQHLPPLPPHLTLLGPNAHAAAHLNHMPPHHLTMAQQHALHQHLLMQQQQRMENLAPPMRQDIQDIIQRLQNNAAAQLNVQNGPFSPPNAQTRLTPDATSPHLKRERSPIPVGMELAQNPPQRHQPPHTPPKSVSPQSSQPSSPPALLLPGSPQTSSGLSQPPQHQYPKSMPGQIMPGLVRPFPVGPPQQGMPDIKALPPYINAPPEMPPQHNPHLIAAAQFQMAAALQAGHVLGPAAAGLPPHPGFMPGPPGMPRDSYPLYPWLLSRHGRIFPHRFPGNFLLQPFRKPKRIRTAFSPSQLLKLEHAFENNQYVVGAERKALAQSLNLSETQVKVWFQNRRTKHKRMQQEDEKGGGGSSDRNSQNASCDEEDDELIDMEMDDDCPSDEEHDLDASH